MTKVVCAIIFCGKKVLVAQHNNHPLHQYKWEFPGGKVEHGETPENAIVREIKEELSVVVEVVKRLLPVNYDYGQLAIELNPIICRVKSGTVKLNEHLNYKWAGLEELDGLDFCEADREILNVAANKSMLFRYPMEGLDGCG